MMAKATALSEREKTAFVTPKQFFHCSNSFCVMRCETPILKLLYPVLYVQLWFNSPIKSQTNNSKTFPGIKSCSGVLQPFASYRSPCIQNNVLKSYEEHVSQSKLISFSCQTCKF